jgi:hypothetical protein
MTPKKIWMAPITGWLFAVVTSLLATGSHVTRNWFISEAALFAALLGLSYWLRKQNNSPGMKSCCLKVLADTRRLMIQDGVDNTGDMVKCYTCSNEFVCTCIGGVWKVRRCDRVQRRGARHIGCVGHYRRVGI